MIRQTKIVSYAGANAPDIMTSPFIKQLNYLTLLPYHIARHEVTQVSPDNGQESSLPTLAAAEPLVERAQERMVEPLSAGDRRKLIALLAQLVHLGNDTSRAPQRAIPRGWSARKTKEIE